jgi:hypothetical protein
MKVVLETTVLPAKKTAKLLLHIADVESDVIGVSVTIMPSGNCEMTGCSVQTQN